MAVISVPYNEMTEGLTEGVDSEGLWAKKPYGVLWKDRLQFCRDVMGVSSQSGGINGTWQRQFPLQYPDDNLLYARSIEISPVKPWYTTTPLSYKQAVVVVTFRAPDWNVTTNDDPLFLNSLSQDPTENAGLTYCTQELDWGAEWLSIPTSDATYLSSGQKVTGASLSRRIVVCRMVLTYHKLPYMPLAKIFTYSDVLNDSTFLGRPRGTVMLEGSKTIRERDAAGTITQKLTISLKTRNPDWNQVMLPNGSLDTVIFGGDPMATIYGYINFKPLLFVGSQA